MMKDRLRAFRAKTREAQQLRSHLETMETRIYSPKGQQFTSMPHSQSGNGRTMDDLASAHISLQDRYRALLAAVEREQVEIEDLMVCLEPKERMLIRFRYMDLMSWEEVCIRMQYSRTQINRLHGSALVKLEKTVSS